MSLDCCNPYSGSGSGGGGAGGAGPTWFSFGIQGPIGDGTPDPFTNYVPPGGYVPSTDELFALALTDFTATGLQVYLQGDTKVIGATLTITFRVEAVDTALTVTLGPNDNEGSVSVDVPVTAGQHYSISIAGDNLTDFPSNLVGQIYYTT